MRVFVWVSYGNSAVYAAETREQLRHIYYTIRSTIEEFGEDLGEKPDLFTNIGEKEIMALIYNFGGFSVHEIFQYGTVFQDTING